MSDLFDDHFHDECGVVGVYGHPEASTITHLCLHALQHRGQESAGIVSFDGRNTVAHRAMGLVGDIFKGPVLDELKGHTAIGHVRYSTTGSSMLKNAQPFAIDYSRGALAVAHNGNLVNAGTLRYELENVGSIFQSTMDTEVIAHLIAKGEGNAEERVINALARVKGAYSLVFLTEDRIIAARDPRGWRPLILGKLDGAHVIASETCALDLIEGEYVRDIQPGEILVIDKHGLRSIFPFPKAAGAMCVFEYIYFARPDSRIFGEDCYPVRLAFGARLAQEHPVDADVVIAVPDSGSPATVGYAREAGIPMDIGLVRSHYMGRTFIEPAQTIRHFGVKLKLNPNTPVIAGKRVVLVDDSIVRGTTMRKIVTMIRKAGAKEIHVRISSPPVMWPCYYGIDTPTREELVASHQSVAETAKFIGADSLGYLSMEGLRTCLPRAADEFCYACFNGDYPDPPEEKTPVRQLHLFNATEDKGA
ncbi:MAG: amidophosphoribosyltransferase [Deltaproteobacteria bacterium]|nr:amidophosphoribosyltransferase [Deltaproteobacteria bacterium]